MSKTLVATSLVYLLFSFNDHLKSQVGETPKSSLQDHLGLDQIFTHQFQITHLPSTPIYSQIIIITDNYPEFTITSKPYQLIVKSPGIDIPMEGLTYTSNHERIELKGSILSFMPGDYQICHRIIEMQNSSELMRDCRIYNATATNNTDTKNKDTNPKKNGILLKGEAQLTGFHGQSSYLLPNTAQTYFTLSAAPKLIVHDIPLGLQINYTSDPLVSHYYNRVSFDFNASEYQEILKNKVLNAVLDKYSELSAEAEDWKNKKSQLDNLNALINDSILIQEIQKINDLENHITEISQINDLENQLSELIDNKNELLQNHAIPDNIKQLEVKIQLLKTKLASYKSLTEKLKDFDKLQAKRDQYEFYLNKAEKLKNEISEYKDIEALQGKLTTIEEEIKDPNSLKKYLEEFGLAGKLTPILMAVKRLSVGETQPYYSELTHWGMPVKGIGAGIKIGNQTLGINSGVSRSLPISPIFYPGQPVQHLPGLQINSAQIGWEKEEGDYLRINGLLAKPKEEFIPSKDNIVHDYLKNYRVVSTGFGGNIKNGLLSVNGEIGLSLTENLSGIDVPEENSPYNNLAKSIFGKKGETGIADIAWKLSIKGQFLNRNLVLRIISSDIGQNFHTPGNPYLISGRQNTAVNLDYKFLKNTLAVGTRIEKESFDSSPFQTGKIEMWRYGVNIKIRPKRLPYIVMGYMPYRRVYGTSDYKYDNINFLTGWNYRIGKISTSTTISYQSNQSYFKPINDTVRFFNNTVLNITQSLQFQKFSLSLNLQKMDGNGWGYSGKQLYAQISSTFYFNQFITGQIGFHLQKPEGRQLDYGYLAIFNWQVNRHIAMNFHMNRYQYQAYYDLEIKLTDYSARMGLNIKW